MAHSGGGELGLAGEIVHLALQRKISFSVAESLTGGLLAATIVSVPGASRVFAGGVVAYHLDVKEHLLGVSADLLAERGAVDRMVAEQMALGVRNACGLKDPEGRFQTVDFGVSTTGVAGPDADPETGQPAGTVWIGVSGDADTEATLFNFAGMSRQEIRERSVTAAIQLLKSKLESC